MTCAKPSRASRFSPTLLLAACLFFAACETTPTRPPAPISTGEPRATPGTVPVEQAETDALDEEALAELEDEALEDLTTGYIPPHMTGRDVKRAAVLLPFSHPRSEVRVEAEGLLAGIELAMFNRGEESFVILPKDTAGMRSTAEARALEALEEEVDIIIGPLFAANVEAVRGHALEAEVPVVAFSNAATAAGGGAYLISLAPEEDVARIVDVAARRGALSYAFLGPRTGYGRRVEAALRREAALNGGSVIASAFYDASNEAPVDEAQQVARQIEAESEAAPGTVAVLIPERGVKLRAVAPLLPYYGVDIRRIQLLGTGQWNDPSVWREPTLSGAIFPAPDPENEERFRESYERIYNREPTRLASIGYDAGALASALASADALTTAGVVTQDGFRGVNGLFRFRLDGTAERSLAVLQIKPDEGAVPIEFGFESFDPPAF
ncbi:MAG: penicillin-binding protein activator [Pseudomonadota bacterium]